MIPISCGPFVFGWPQYRVTIAGCTGPAAIFNGIWELIYVGGCQWEILIPAGEYIEVFIVGDPVVDWAFQVLVGLGALTAEYWYQYPPNPTGPFETIKILGGDEFPTTIIIEGMQA